jgi:16S rRNA A1518/A1519 N6-dimethyltransferase RsmA/KsgA/DIM1 with predicted DNA glycosylase/AP lyase activity
VKLVKNLFQQRRKTIYNTLRSFYSLSDAALKNLADATGVDLGSRPEELDKETFIALSRKLIGAESG